MTKLLILAAGMGSRYGGIKQIEPVGPNGEIIVDYSIYDAKKSDINKFIFVIRKELETDFRNLLESKYKGNLDYKFVFQKLEYCVDNKSLCSNRKKPWGTAHAILCAEQALNNDPFIVINADDYYGPNSFQILNEHIKNQKDENLSMVAYELGSTLSDFGTVSRGVCKLDTENYLSSITELKKIKKFVDNIVAEDDLNFKLFHDTPVSMNFWGFNKHIFKYLKNNFNKNLTSAININDFEYFIPLFISELIKEKIFQTKVLQTKDSWFGITYKEDKEYVLKQISLLIKNKFYPERIF